MTGTLFDPGPPAGWAALLATAPLDAYRAHPGDFRLPFGPVWYRGRLDGSARVLVVGQDPSTDEVMGQRTFVGETGQRVQGLLRKLGVNRSYVMVNTFLYGIRRKLDARLEGLALSEPIRGWREAFLARILEQNPIEAVVAFGAAPALALGAWSTRPARPPLVCVAHPATDASFAPSDWNRDLPALRAAIAPEAGQRADDTPYGAHFAAADLVDVPRADLPFGLPDWHGAGGVRRSFRDGDDAIRWQAP
jgi:hypothetical protein